MEQSAVLDFDSLFAPLESLLSNISTAIGQPLLAYSSLLCRACYLTLLQLLVTRPVKPDTLRQNNELQIGKGLENEDDDQVYGVVIYEVIL